MDELKRGRGGVPVALTNTSLTTLPKGITRPSYDRSVLTPGIVHIGLGNFHRAHQAWYLHRLMQLGGAQDWAIIGAGVRPNDAAMREALLAQDCLTTLIELDPNGTRAEIAGAMIDFVPVEGGNAALIKAMMDPRIRIVSLTVTEGGYYREPTSGGFDADHPDMVHDAKNANRPSTAFGAIVAALKQRRADENGPFTVQSCDNLQGNGAITRQTVVSLAKLTDPGLAAWIDSECSFPDSMVDCIVPATGPAERTLAQQLGVLDHVPVTHENFRQWVIEEDFCAGRPEWERVGATLTNDVHAYETMKIRILNAGHQILANAGEILAVETIAGCMAHSSISALFHKVEREEIAPYVVPVPGMTPPAYVDLIAQRFANPAIRDTTRRVAFDGSSRHPGFVLPIVRDALAAEGSIAGLALIEALWARMCAGVREDGSPIEPNDPFWDSLVIAANAARARPRAWLEQSHYYGDLIDEPHFAVAFEDWLKRLWSDGCEATLRAYCAS